MRIVIVVIALLFSFTASAQQTLFRQTSPIILIQPENGGYFDPTRPGNGIMVEVADDGFVFGAFFYYDSLGIAKWNTIQGFCEPVSEQVRMTTDVVCKVSPSAMFEARDGQCWGCPWRQNSSFVSTDMNTGVEAVFFGPTRGEIRANGSVLPIRRLSEVYPGQTARDRILGQWSRVRFRKAKDCPSCGEYVVAQDIGVVQIDPRTTTINFMDVANPAGFPNTSVDALPVFPSASAPQYEVKCIDNGRIGDPTRSCSNFDSVGLVDSGSLIYEEQGSSMFRLAYLCTNRNLPDCERIEGSIGSFVQLNAISFRADLYVSRNKINVRFTTQVAGAFVIQEEEVWTKRDKFPRVPITTPWPF